MNLLSTYAHQTFYTLLLAFIISGSMHTQALCMLTQESLADQLCQETLREKTAEIAELLGTKLVLATTLSSKGSTAICLAAGFNKIDSLEAIIHFYTINRMNLNELFSSRCSQQKTPLMWAISRSNEMAVREILQHYTPSFNETLDALRSAESARGKKLKCKAKLNLEYSSQEPILLDQISRLDRIISLLESTTILCNLVFIHGQWIYIPVEQIPTALIQSTSMLQPIKNILYNLVFINGQWVYISKN